MTQRDPQREPQSETVEKKPITKAHEEFIGSNRPSKTKQEYEEQKETERKRGGEKEKPNPHK